MVTNVTLGQPLTPELWNNAFSSFLDLTKTTPQVMTGALTVPQITAPISVVTQDLVASGNVVFSGTSVLQIPAGTTLQRSNRPTAGALRFNVDSGTFEGYLPTGKWVAFSTTATTQTPTSQPVSQSAVSFGQASSTSIACGWTLPNGGTGPFTYTLYYRPTGTTNYKTWASNLTTLSATISGLLPATRYDFYVESFNSAGSAVSPVSSSNTLGYLSGGPAGLAATNATATTLHLSWMAINTTLPVAYTLNYAVVGASTWTHFSATDATNITVTGLIPNTSYMLQVVAQTTGGSYESVVVQASTTAISTVAPNAPGTPTLSSPTANSVAVSWSAPTQGTAPFSYVMELQINGGAWIDSFYPPTTALTQVANQLTSGQTVNIRIKAINSVSSATSQAVAVTPPAQTPVASTVAGFQLSTYLGNGPFLSAPQAAQLYTSSSIDLIGITVSDPNAAYNPGTLALSVSCGAGTVTMTDAAGNRMDSSGTQTFDKVPLTFSTVQSVLKSLAYTAPANPVSDTVAITLTDQLSNSTSVTIAINVVKSIGTTTPSPTGSPPPSTSGSGSGLRTGTGQPTDTAGKQASAMVKPLRLFGVGLTPEASSYGGFSAVNAAATENAINYIGAGNLGFARVNVGSGFSNAAEQQFLSQVAANCGTLDYIISLDVNNLGNFSWQQVLTNVTTFQQNFGLVAAVAGVTNAGGALALTQSNILAAASFQANIQAVTGTLNAQSMGYTTWYNQGTPTNSPNPYTDVGYAYCFPAYAPNQVVASGTTPVASYTQTAAIALSQNQASLPLQAATEFGWNMYNDTGTPVSAFGYASQTSAASYLLIYLFNNYKFSTGSGLSSYAAGQCVWADLFNNNASLYGNAMGLFAAPGSPPTVAAQALRQTYQLLYDSAPTATTFTPGLLDYSLSYSNGLPAAASPNMGANDLLFQKSDGSFVIVLWNEQQLNNSTTNAPIAVNPQPVTVTFNTGTMLQVNYYDPFVPSTGSVPQPTLTASHAATMTVPVQTHPTYLVVQHV